jgi:hypothetical protein
MSKTVFKTFRLVQNDATNTEYKLNAAFYLDDVKRWEEGNEGVFKLTEITTVVFFDSGECIYTTENWKYFDTIMSEYNNRQGDLTIQMKQN